MKLSLTPAEFRGAFSGLSRQLKMAHKEAATATARADRSEQEIIDLRNQLYVKDSDLLLAHAERYRHKQDYEWQYRRATELASANAKLADENKSLQAQIHELETTTAKNQKSDSTGLPMKTVSQKVTDLVKSLSNNEIFHNRVLALKLIRELTGLGLRDAKGLMDGQIIPVMKHPPLSEEPLS